MAPSFAPPSVPRGGASVATTPKRSSCLVRLNLSLLVVQATLLPALYYHFLVVAPDVGGSGGNDAIAQAMMMTGLPQRIPPPPPPVGGGAGGNSTVTAPRDRLPPPDGTFNGRPVRYVDPSSSSSRRPLVSSVHCMGENFGDRSWLHRSCSFSNLCFDLDAKDFVLFPSPLDAALTEARVAHPASRYVSISSSSVNTSVSLGGINPQWTWKPNQSEALEWFPIVEDGPHEGGYYQLDGDGPMVPFHSMAAINVGHLLWDDFYPIFTLLRTFGLDGGGGGGIGGEEGGGGDAPVVDPPVLVRYVLKNRPRALWATCDLRDKTGEICRALFGKFLPLMGSTWYPQPEGGGKGKPAQMTTENSILTLNDGSPPKSRYVCARRGAAGLGMLTDHGLKRHGWDGVDYESTHNIGRGPVMYEFRNYMMRNLGLSNPDVPANAKAEGGRIRIVISKHSSKDPDRRTGFDHQIGALTEAMFAEDGSVSIEAHQFKDLSVLEQVKITAGASILITACGGGAVTAMFLPRNAALIAYFPDKPTTYARNHKHPARLDWDFLNNMGYARVHWMPTTGMDEKEGGLKVLVALVRNEIEMIRGRR